VSTLVVGSIALDTVETPFGRVENALGGTAVFFSLAAGLFSDVQLVGVVGEDFPASGEAVLAQRGVDLAGLQRVPGKTFRWVGEYDYDMNVAHTLDTRLNVFESFHPALPDHYRDAHLVFLGNIDPSLQLDVLEQIRSPRFTALDTMNFWIERKRDELTEVIKHVDAVLFNESEIRQYTDRFNVWEAAQEVHRLGPRCVVVKRGEYGSVMFHKDTYFSVPAFPTWDVRDTTGAGDSFAGGFMGYLDTCSDFTDEEFRAAMVNGTLVASYTVEDFSIDGLMRADIRGMRQRHESLAEATRIGEPVLFNNERLIGKGA